MVHSMINWQELSLRCQISVLETGGPSSPRALRMLILQNLGFTSRRSRESNTNSPLKANGCYSPIIQIVVRFGESINKLRVTFWQMNDTAEDPSSLCRYRWRHQVCFPASAAACPAKCHRVSGSSPVVSMLLWRWCPFPSRNQSLLCL